jgi:hypothetical protein
LRLTPTGVGRTYLFGANERDGGAHRTSRQRPSVGPVRAVGDPCDTNSGAGPQDPANRRSVRHTEPGPIRAADHREDEPTTLLVNWKIDAERWLAEQQARLTWGEWVDPAASRVSFGAVASEWLDAAAHLKPKTRASYSSSLLRTRVLPTRDASH